MIPELAQEPHPARLEKLLSAGAPQAVKSNRQIKYDQTVSVADLRSSVNTRMTTANILHTGASVGVSQNVSAKEIRRIIIEQSKRAGVGHIGSGLCIAEILSVLYGQVMNIPSPDDQDRDRFILSKGHAALALYAALYLRGWITKDQLNSFCGDGTAVGVHPEHTLTGIDFSTGSLGQGLTFAAGAALAAKLQKSKRRTFVVLSDAECNEGSVWEAIMFAAHHKLSNLIVIVDLNGQQAFGYTDQVLNLSPMSDRWKAFGWEVHSVDGHDTKQLVDTISRLDTQQSGPPHVLLAKTTFGKGVSFMEGQIKWHYSPLNDEEYKQALAEIGAQA